MDTNLNLSAEEQKIVSALKQSVNDAVTNATKNNVSQEDVAKALVGMKTQISDEILEPIKAAQAKAEEIAVKQGTTLAEIANKLDQGGRSRKSIAQTLKDDEGELKSIFKNRNGQKTYLLNYDSKGEPYMVPFDETSKNIHATVNAVGAPANVAAITQNMSAAAILRLGGGANIVSQYRNTPWIFDLCNVTTAGFDNPFAIWIEETARTGGSATVLEGQPKPTAQYNYKLNATAYKKEAVMVTFTEEFHLDFPRLEADIMQKVQVDLRNRVSSSILPNVIASATLYNTGALFQGGLVVPNVNDYDVIAAMNAQSDNATFGAMANAAVMSTFKKHRLGITKDNSGDYLMVPPSIANLNFIGNSDMATDAVLVGDFSSYNIIQRGGVIVRVGYNNDDFATNKFSVVAEQFYFDYIADSRKAGIVYSPTFAAVRTAISI